MPIIYCTIQGVKYANKKYKEHKAKKDQQEKGTPVEIRDPSNEVTYGAVELPAPHTSTSHSSNTINTSSPHLSVHPTEPDTDPTLENDIEFQHFMQRQKQLYLEQKRALRKSSGSSISRSSSPAELSPVSAISTDQQQQQQPPSYDAVMSQQGYVDARQYPTIAELPASLSRSRLVL